MKQTIIASVAVLTLFLSTPLRSDAANQQVPVLVTPQANDCINTFILRVGVAASNVGAAYGYFDGSQIQMMRRGTSPRDCRIEMVQLGPNGQVEAKEVMRCFFEYPLGN